MLIVKKLNKSINKKVILKNVSLDFKVGKLYPILGGNGSGRTTLFQCISGDFKYEDGSVTIKHGYKAVLAHKHGLMPINLTGFQFMKFICANAENSAESVADRIEEIFRIVNINEETSHTLIKEYSFVNKRKLQLAQFLVQKPYVIMFDEPFDYCDDSYIDEFLGILNSLKEEHIILISTGLLPIAKKISKEVIVLSHGEANIYKEKSLKDKQIEKEILKLLGDDEDGEE